MEHTPLPVVKLDFFRVLKDQSCRARYRTRKFSLLPWSENLGAQISPDEYYVSFITPLENVLNIWAHGRSDVPTLRFLSQDRHGFLKNPSKCHQIANIDSDLEYCHY